MSVILKSNIESIDIHKYSRANLGCSANLGYGISLFEHYCDSRNSLLETGYLILWI
jgi:hypothetical protein